MKIIFLDIDGVLNYEGCAANYGGVYFLSEEKLELLAEIIRRTGAKIVLTSTWRQGAMDMAEGTDSFEADLYTALINALDEHDLYIYDCTELSETTRGEQIAAWLEGRTDIESFVILDDINVTEFGTLADYLVQTDISQGLERHHVEMAVQILNES